MTVPGQRSTTERATTAHHLDDAQQISIHSASLTDAQLQPAAARAVNAPKEHGRDHTQSLPLGHVRRCVHGGGSFRFIMVAARNRSPHKFLLIFISKIGSGAASSAGNGKRITINDAVQQWRRQDMTREDNK